MENIKEIKIESKVARHDSGAIAYLKIVNEFGKKISDNKERNKKISQSHIGKSHPRTQEWSNKIGNSNKKPILQYDLEDNFIKEWSSAIEASLFIGCLPSPITACCKGKQKTCYKFKWKYKNE